MLISRDAVYSRMREFFLEGQAVDPDGFTAEARIREDLGTDSLDFIAFTIVLEDLLDGVAIPAAQIVRIVTVDDAINLVLAVRGQTAIRC